MAGGTDLHHSVIESLDIQFNDECSNPRFDAQGRSAPGHRKAVSGKGFGE